MGAVKGTGLAATAALGFSLTAGMGTPLWLEIIANSSTALGWAFNGGATPSDLISMGATKGFSKVGGQLFGSATGGGYMAQGAWEGHVKYGKAIYSGVTGQQDD